MERSTRVIVIGAGGNIGSHLVPHLARTPEIGSLTLVDRDVYEGRNVGNQDVSPGSVRRNKAVVQAARARRLNPRLRVHAVPADVETMPLGALRGDLILACVDSRRARQRVNQAAWRLGVPWIDAGVLGDGLLARVTGYVPGPDQACLECGWSDSDYAAVEQAYPCGASNGTAPPTTAPSSLGALAAALQAIECRKVLTGHGTALTPGRDLVMDASHLRHFVTAARRNPVCRMTDHAPWAIEPLAGARPMTLRAVLDLADGRLGLRGRAGLRVDGQRLALAVACGACDTTRRPLRPASRLRPADSRCPSCGEAMAVPGFGLVERLERSALTAEELDRPLGAMGLAVGEVLSLGTDEREVHFEIVER